MKRIHRDNSKQLVDDPSTVVVTEEEVEGRIVFKIKVDKREVGKINWQARTKPLNHSELFLVQLRQRAERVRLEILD